MQIESITVKNYRLFRDAKLENIPRLCVLVGANGTGKSTLFDVFSFLKDALSMNVGKAIAKGDLVAELGLGRLVASAWAVATAGGQYGCSQQRERERGLTHCVS